MQCIMSKFTKIVVPIYTIMYECTPGFIREDTPLSVLNIFRLINFGPSSECDGYPLWFKFP